MSKDVFKEQTVSISNIMMVNHYGPYCKRCSYLSVMPTLETFPNISCSLFGTYLEIDYDNNTVIRCPECQAAHIVKYEKHNTFGTSYIEFEKTISVYRNDVFCSHWLYSEPAIVCPYIQPYKKTNVSISMWCSLFREPLEKNDTNKIKACDLCLRANFVLKRIINIDDDNLNTH